MANLIIQSTGSHCIKEFGGDLQEKLKTEEKAKKKSINLKLLEEKFPGIRKLTDNCYRYVGNLDMIIPQSYSERWKEKSSSLVKEYYNYVESRHNNITAIELLWKDVLGLKQEIDKFIKENKNKRYAANKRIYNWLKKNKQDRVILKIREDNGFIKWRTAHRIYEEQFMKEVIINLKNELEILGVFLKEINPTSNKVVIKFKKTKSRLWPIYISRS